MKRNILLQFEDEDDYADVLVAIRSLNGASTKDPGERGKTVAAICRARSAEFNAKVTNGAPLPGQTSFLPDPKDA